MSTLLLQVVPLAAAPPAKPGALAGGAQAPAPSGIITGTAQGSTGQVLPNYTVQVRNLQTGQLVGTTTSDAAGNFSFAGLTPANYVVEVVNQAGVIVGTSAPIAVVAGATVVVTVSATAAAIAAGTGGGVSTALIVTLAAVAAGVVTVVAVRANASPSR